mgnify:FL=1
MQPVLLDSELLALLVCARWRKSRSGLHDSNTSVYMLVLLFQRFRNMLYYAAGATGSGATGATGTTGATGICYISQKDNKYDKECVRTPHTSIRVSGRDVLMSNALT